MVVHAAGMLVVFDARHLAVKVPRMEYILCVFFRLFCVPSATVFYSGVQVDV